MSKQGVAGKKLDRVAEVLSKLSKRTPVDPKDAEAAIDEHNKMQDLFRIYMDFYEKNKGSYAKKMEGHGEDRQLEKKEQEDYLPGGPNALKKLRVENEKLMFERGNLEKQIDELKNRLSNLAGEKMANNTDIADLSDPHRPTQLAEKFRQIYDDEWTQAFEELDNQHISEFKIIEFLSNIIKDIDTFCGKASEEQVTQIIVTVSDDVTNPKVHGKEHNVLVGNTRSEMDSQQRDRLLKKIQDLRKSFGSLSVRPLTQIFDKLYMQTLRTTIRLPQSSSHVNSFVVSAVGVIWLMKIQQPPMEFLWQKEGEKYDKAKFTFYTKRGDIVKQTVWPAVLLHSQGALMSKGILQAK